MNYCATIQPEPNFEYEFDQELMGAWQHSFQVLLVAIRLGLTSFGGPIAHIGYFRAEYVERRHWIDEQDYIDVVSLCQVLPGPTSSQVGIIVGISRAGLPGGLAAWLGFTLPSAIALILFALGIANLAASSEYGWVHGLKIMAVGVVALAVWTMARNNCTDRIRITIAMLSAACTLMIDNPLTQISLIAIGAISGWLLLKNIPVTNPSPSISLVGKPVAALSLTIFALLLLILPAISYITADPTWELADRFYRTGSLVFGGGHVVLPILQSEVVDTGWVLQDTFLAGYGAAQAIPGPLFTFAAFLGASTEHSASPILLGIFCLIMIFAPSFLLIVGVLPFWNALRSVPRVRGIFGGINASVVGLLMAALYDPIWTNGINGFSDFAIGIGITAMLAIRIFPIWFVVLTAASLGQIITTLPSLSL